MSNTYIAAPVSGIRCAETGALAMIASIIMQAVEDVRLYLQKPQLNDKNVIESRHNTNERAQRAKQAATWLQGEECRYLVNVLKACGYRVPMKRLYRELAALKVKQQPKPLG